VSTFDEIDRPSRERIAELARLEVVPERPGLGLYRATGEIVPEHLRRYDAFGRRDRDAEAKERRHVQGI
jgi:hypothetical protein